MSQGYPSTHRPVTRGPAARQADAFDPAVKQYPCAFHPGEPVFEDPQLGERWRRARRSALEQVLSAVAGSRWHENLVLRGSVLMRAWFGRLAREPGDIDFVVTPWTTDVNGDTARAMFDDIMTAVLAGSVAAGDPGAVRFDPDVAIEGIWTYERAPGRRMVFTWTVPGLPPGTVQVDAVFGEPLPQEPDLAQFPRAGGGPPILLPAAGPELSLAWKLLWLETDNYPQGKDLYDAVLLAEHAWLPAPLLRTVLARELGERASDFRRERVLEWGVDWENFRLEHPGIGGDVHRWQQRLYQALAATFDA